MTSATSSPPAWAPMPSRPMSSRGCWPTATASRSSWRSCSPGWWPPAPSPSTDGHWSTTGPLSPSIPVRRRAVDPPATRRPRPHGPAGHPSGRAARPPVRLGAAPRRGGGRRPGRRRGAAGGRRRADHRGRGRRLPVPPRAVAGGRARRAAPAGAARPRLPRLARRRASQPRSARAPSASWPPTSPRRPGSRGAAAERLVESARRALAGGAYATAEATAERARRLAPPDEPVALDAVPGARADPGGRRQAGRGAGPGPPARRAAARQRHARRRRPAARDGPRRAGRRRRRRGRPAHRRRAGGPRRTTRRWRPGSMRSPPTSPSTRGGSPTPATWPGEPSTPPPRPSSPRSRARRSRCSAGSPTSRPPARATQWFQRAADLAAAHGLAGWELRARHELALQAWGDGDTRPLREVRDLAARTGALVTQAVMDLSLADLALAAFDRDGVPGRRHVVRRGEPPLRARHRAGRPPVAGRRPRAGRRRRGDGGIAGRRAGPRPRRPTDPGRPPRPGARDPRVRRRRPRVAPGPPRRDDGARRPRAPRRVGLPGPRAVGDPAHDRRRRPRRVGAGGLPGVGRRDGHAHHRPRRPRRGGGGAGPARRHERGRRSRRAGAASRATRSPSGPGSGTASRSWCRWRPSATAGATPPPGCGSPRRSSRPGATSAPPGAAGR